MYVQNIVDTRLDGHEIEILHGLQVTLRYSLTMDNILALFFLFCITTLPCSGATNRREELDRLRVGDATHVLRGPLDGFAAVPRSYFPHASSSRILTSGHLTWTRRDQLEILRRIEDEDGYLGYGLMAIGDTTRHKTTSDELEAHRSHRSPSFMSGVRASPPQLALSCFFILLLVDCPMYIPIRDHPSAHLQATTT